jgi:hypothetical protein
LSVRQLIKRNSNCPQYLKEYIEVKSFITHYGNQF